MLPNFQTRSAQTQSSHFSGLVLEILNAGATQSVLLDAGEWTIGSERSNRIVVDEPTVRDRHCREIKIQDIVKRMKKYLFDALRFETGGQAVH